jgi:hypothetical protein
MMYMLMLILADCGCLDALLDAWEAVGIRGITIVESTGIQRRRVQRARVPLRFDFAALVHTDQQGHYTLFAIVADEEMARRGLTAAESVLGDLDEPDTGVLTAWPLALVKGVPSPQSPEEPS